MTRTNRLWNPFVQQYLVEIVFPLLGYFFFDWDILIIGAYYLIDHLCGQLLFFKRAYAVNTKNNQGAGIHFLLFSILGFLVLFMVEIMGFNYTLLQTQGLGQNAIISGFYAFAKSELWLLFPVLLFICYFKDQFTFFAPRRYMLYDHKKMLLWDFVNNLSILLLLALGGWLWIQTQLSDIAAIGIFLAVKIGFDLTLKPFVNGKGMLTI